MQIHGYVDSREVMRLLNAKEGEEVRIHLLKSENTCAYQQVSFEAGDPDIFLLEDRVTSLNLVVVKRGVSLSQYRSFSFKNPRLNTKET